MIEERIQAVIHKFEVDSSRWLNYAALTLIVVALAVWYDTHCYRNFESPEAMDAAQVARNIAEGNGYTTEYIRPFSAYLLQRHNGLLTPDQLSTNNVVDNAQVFGRHPDLANAPLYPVMLAGLWQLTRPDWLVEMHKPFWSDGGRFTRYKPEFIVAIFNQLLLLVTVLLTFLVARTILDTPAAWLAAVLMFCSDELWKLSVSGLPTLLLMVIFLGLAWCLAAFEALNRAEKPEPRRQFKLAIIAGLLAGLGMLTRYSFGWVLVPVVLFFVFFGGTRRKELAAMAVLVCSVLVLPWVLRNFIVSGTPFGTAGYAMLEGTFVFPELRLEQSLSPDMSSAHLIKPYLVKLLENSRLLLRDEVPRLGGGWIAILFLAGLLLGLRNQVARRMRYFTMMCLGMFLVASAMGRTQLSVLSDQNTENMLVLLTPLALIFGIAFFLTMLNQMELPSVPIRYTVIGLMVLLLRLQFILMLLPPRVSPVVFPPYYPPEIQQFSGWMQPNELMMSDVPWAVAWYGDRQCALTTINYEYEFYQFNDNVKPVRGLYLSFDTLDAKLWSECLHGENSWANFALKFIVAHQTPDKYPLKASPYLMKTGLFLTDHQRWPSE